MLMVRFPKLLAYNSFQNGGGRDLTPEMLLISTIQSRLFGLDTAQHSVSTSITNQITLCLDLGLLSDKLAGYTGNDPA